MKMTAHELRDMVARSATLSKLNGHIAPSGEPKAPQEAPAKPKLRTSPRPKTRPEVEMSAILERELKSGAISSFSFEGITLEVGDGMRYTPDFSVWENDGTLRFIEVKGGFIRRTGIQAFKAAKGKYPKAKFEMWQLDSGRWEKL